MAEAERTAAKGYRWLKQQNIRENAHANWRGRVQTIGQCDRTVLWDVTRMQAMRILFLPSGRLPPRDFVVPAIAVYLAGAASLLLTVPNVSTHGGLWLFAAAQALLTWVWFALHAKRLRDANRPIGIATGVSLLYALSIVVLLIVAVAFFAASEGSTTDASTANALGLVLLVWIIATLSGSNNYDLAWLMVMIFTALAFLPIVLALAVTVFAATWPSAEKKAA